MPGLVVAALLSLSLLLVHFSLRAKPMPPDRPLDVDDDLPLPELAQSSTVFSLTALFGAYFGVAVALGLPALTGLACGTVLGLFLVRYWIDRTLASVNKPEEKKFETFLSRILEGDERNATVYAFMISAAQCIYAACELLILRELTKVALGLSSEQATLLAIAVGIIGYFYVLLGGYMALFRTDVVQLALVSMMAVASGVVLLVRYSSVGWASKLLPRPGFWELPLLGSSRWLYLYHFVIAAVMGLGLLLASPDTWKRVFQVGKRKLGPRRSMLTLVGVGTLPYVVLLPFAIAISLNVDGPVNQGARLSPMLYDSYVFVAVALGIIASFLSAFNGALLASVHIQLILRRKKLSERLEEAAFYWRMVTVLLSIYILFIGALVVFNNPSRFEYRNPWLLSNMLMGLYATIGGVQIATRGDISRLPGNRLQWIFALGVVGWLLYFFTSPGFSKVPKIHSVNTVPAGVGVCLATALLSKLFMLGGRKYDRRRSNGG